MSVPRQSLATRLVAPALVLAAAILAAPRHASASVVFTDGFGDGDRDNNGTAETTATNPADTGVAWYLAAGTSAVTIGAVDDSAGIGSGNALQLFNTSGNNRPIVAAFPTQTLADGDQLVLKFDVRIVSNSATVNRNFRFGLYNDAGTVATLADKGTADTTANDDIGYMGRVDLGADASDNTSMDIVRDNDTATIIGGNVTNLSPTTGSSNSANQLTDNLKHHFVLSYTRSGASMLVSLQEDSNTVLTGTDATALATSFSEVMFTARSGATTDYRIDNVEVDYNAAAPVPEPTTALTLLPLAATTLAARRRRR